jgi:hypothetical protein
MSFNYPIQDYILEAEDFLGGATISTTVGEGKWKITDTSAAGTPTYAKVNEHGGAFAMTFSNTSEIQNLCLDCGDVLQYDIDQMIDIEFRIKAVATLAASTTLTFGLNTARNDNPDSTTAHAQFQLSGSNAVLVETDDNVLDISDIATGQTLGAAYKKFVISFAYGKRDVRFYIDNVRVGANTLFNMGSFTTNFQPFVQIQKTADTNVNSVTVDLISVRARRV